MKRATTTALGKIMTASLCLWGRDSFRILTEVL